MEGDGFVLVPLKDGGDRWMRKVDGGFEIKVRYDAASRAKTVEAITAGLHFSSALDFAQTLVSLRLQLEATGLLSSMSLGEFTPYGHELLVAAASQADRVERVQSVVQSRVQREIRNLKLARQSMPRSSEERSYFEQYVREACEEYYSTEGPVWESHEPSFGIKGEETKESRDRLVYLRRGFWIEIAGVVGFRVLNGDFIDDLAPPASRSDLNWFALRCEGVADAMDANRNFDFVASQTLHVRAARRLRARFSRHDALDEWLNMNPDSAYPDYFTHFADFIRTHVGRRYDVTPPDYGPWLVVGVSGRIPRPFEDVLARANADPTPPPVATGVTTPPPEPTSVSSGKSQGEGKSGSRRIELLPTGDGFELLDTDVGLVVSYKPRHLGGQMMRAALVMPRDRPLDLVKIRQKILFPNEDVGLSFPDSLVEEFRLTPARFVTRSEAPKSDPRELSIQTIRQPLTGHDKGVAFEAAWLEFDRSMGTMLIRSEPNVESIRPGSE